MVIDNLEILPGCTLPSRYSAIEELYDWSLNFESNRNPICVFADIVGYSDHALGCQLYPYAQANLNEVFGYKELCMLADALKVFEDDGFPAVYDCLDKLFDYSEED